MATTQMAAIRAVLEGVPPTFPLIGKATGKTAAYLRQLASQEDWKKADFRYKRVTEAWRDGAHRALVLSDPAFRGESIPTPDAVLARDMQGPLAELLPDEPIDPKELRGRFMQVLSNELAGIIADAERGRVEPSRLDRLSKLARVYRSDILAAEREVAEEKTRSDEELAEQYQRIDDRIVELAKAYAKVLVAGGDLSALD